MKKKIILIIVLSLILIAIPIVLYAGLKIRLIGDGEYDQTVYEPYFDNGCIATFFGMENEYEIVNGKVDTDRFGDYELEYQTRFAFISKSVKRIVHVIDDVKPEISLNGSEEQFISPNEEYVEMGYSAQDNYDGDLSDKVIVNGNVDTSREGVYELVYSVSDSSGNSREKTRRIEVKENSYLSLPVADFWVNDIFPEIILEPQEEESGLFADTVLLGDSNTWFLYKWSSLIEAKQCWGKRNLNIAEINGSTFINFIDEKERTLKESIELYQPKYLVISPGIGSPLFMKDTVRYVEELKKCIDYLRSEHPEVTFAFATILPVNDGQLSKEFQKQINIYNYYLAEVCHNYKVNLINFADTIRGADGYGMKSKLVYNMERTEDQGFHLSEATREDYVDYLKRLDFNRVIE